MTNWENSKNIFSQNGISAHDNVPKDVLNWIIENGLKAKNEKNTYNHNLIGHLKEEYVFKDIPNFVEEYIVSRAFEGPFFEKWKDLTLLTHNVPVCLSSLWINFQKKHEFNPFHDHGGFASFIIFVNIPYDLKEEEKVFTGFEEKAVVHTSKLLFFNYDHTGRANPHVVPVDKSFEGNMVMFDAKHTHEVYPFYTSDDYRITVSGNLKFDTSLYKDYFNDR